MGVPEVVVLEKGTSPSVEFSVTLGVIGLPDLVPCLDFASCASFALHTMS